MGTELWFVIKYTFVGKVGALLIGSAPLIFAVEFSNHVDALIAALPPTAAVILGVFALRKGQKSMMVNIDGRMEQLLSQTAKASLSEGKEEERKEARDRRDEINVQLKTHNTREEPSEVTIVNKPSNPANVKVGNLLTEPVPTTILEKKEEIKKLEKEVEKQQEEE